MKTLRKRRASVHCPHCEHIARVYASRQLSPTTFEKNAECLNDACGFEWVLHISAVRALSPSLLPNPDVHVPLGPRRAIVSGHDLVARRPNDILIQQPAMGSAPPAPGSTTSPALQPLASH